jgi:hypothetical protein
LLQPCHFGVNFLGDLFDPTIVFRDALV